MCVKTGSRWNVTNKQDAPPIKRNVPRPSVSNYGGAGVFDAGPSSSPSHHRLTGSISASGSVSGMSLYIPPYAKPDDIAPPPMNHSSSFGNLGVPPIQRQSTVSESEHGVTVH